MANIVLPTQTQTQTKKTQGKEARMSSEKQENDLGRQLKALKKEVFKDSHTRLLEQVQRGAIRTPVVSQEHIARFTTAIIEWSTHQYGGQLIIQNSNTKPSEQELTVGLMAIVHVCSCRLNGQ